MKKIILLFTLATTLASTACKKDSLPSPENLPRTTVPAELKGAWMYGYFSMTEYWTTNPSTYLGPAVQFAVAFQLEENGSYTHYFTSSTVTGGIATYQQSVTKGTLEIDPASQTIKMHAAMAHYKRTRSNQVLEERDLAKKEITPVTTYKYTTGTESSGTKALYLTLNGTTSPLTFLKK